MSEEEGMEIRDKRLVGYYWIESTVLKEYGEMLGPCGIAVYNALACFANNKTNETYVSAATIANLTGMSEKQVYRELMKLRGDDKEWLEKHNLGELKLVEYEPRPGRPGLYTLIILEKNPEKVKKQKAKTGW